MMDRFLFGLVSLLVLSAGVVHGQLQIASSGNVGINASPTSTAALRASSGTPDKFTIFATNYTAGSSTTRYGGFFDVASSAASTTYGLFSTGSYAVTNYGVFGKAYGGTNNYAGYFSGNVYATGSITELSDANLKEGIATLVARNALDQILQLSPKSYTYRSGPDLANMGLPLGKQVGLLAQEVEQVIPEVIGTFVQPPPVDAEGNLLGEPSTYKGISYTKLVPYLIGAIQEQQAQIEALKAALVEAGITVQGQN
jgi:hypothetical protein